MIARCRKVPQTIVLALLACLVASPTFATGPGSHTARGTFRGGFASPPRLGPAGPTPFDPAGPTPLNPAGPTPLNPTGPSIGLPLRGALIQQPDFVVGVV